MAQVSYGTITITDTTDIENIYAVYAGSEDITSSPNTMDFNLWITDVSQVTGYYIWQRIVTKPYGIEITEENFQDYYGAPVCITGAGGRSIENIITYYCNYGEGRPPEGYEGWQIGIPEYNIEKPNYWVKTVIIYTDNFKQTLSLEDDIISIDNNNKQYIKSLSVTLDPIQEGSGTPSPDNIRPISGRTEVVTQRTGVNVWDEEWEVGNIDVTTGLPYSDNSRIRSKNFTRCLPNTTYYFTFPASKHTSTGDLYFVYYDENKNHLGDISGWSVNSPITTPANAFYFKFKTSATYGNVYNNDISINYPSTDHDYHAYNGTTYTTSLGRTVYGGQLDVVSGELMVDRAMVDLGALGWASSAISQHGNRFYTNNFVDAKPPTDTSAMLGLVCSEYEEKLPSQYNQAVQGITIYTNRTIQIYDASKSSMTISEFKTAMDGQTLVYPLATPQTYQLTPQEVSLLLGQNNVWSDGAIQFESVSTIGQDVQIYLDKGVTNALVQVQEAIDQANNNINSITRLWYLTDTSNVPNQPNEPITEESIEVINKWSINKPVAENYRYYYYCDQICTGGGDYSWTDVVPDTSVLLPYEIHSFDTIVKHHWLDSSGYHLASGINNEEIDVDDSSTYGYISTLGLNNLTFGYNDSNAIELSTNALTFYQPPSISQIPRQGKKTMSLTENALRFYNPNDGQTIMAEFNGNGLTIYSKDANNINNPIASYGEEIIVGNKNSFHIKIGANQGQGELGFYKDETNKIAYLSGDMLYINKSVVVSEMDIGQKWNGVNSFGQWSWKLHKNIDGKNNLNLKWIG